MRRPAAVCSLMMQGGWYGPLAEDAQEFLLGVRSLLQGSLLGPNAFLVEKPQGGVLKQSAGVGSHPM